MVLPNLNGGGAQRMALDLAKRLEMSGDEVAVCAAGSKGSMRTEVGALDLYEQEARIRLTSVVSFIRFLRRTVRDYEPDVIVVHLLPLNMLVLALRRLRLIRAPIAVVEHSHLSATERAENASTATRAWRRFAISMLYPRAAAVVGVCADVAHDIAVRLTEPVNVVAIPNAIDVRRIRADAAALTEEAAFVAGLEYPVLVAVGRLVHPKGFDDLLDAFEQVRAHDACANSSLVILGDGPDRAALEAQGRRLGVDGSVHFLGFVANPWAVMTQADVFVLSSRHEGFGLVVAEAVACGLPVVSTDCESGPAEILRGNPSSRLVPVGDTAAMADAVCEVLTEAGGATPVELAPEFTVEVMTAQYRELLLGIVAMSRGRESQ